MVLCCTAGYGPFNGRAENNSNAFWDQSSNWAAIASVKEKGHREIDFWKFDTLPPDLFCRVDLMVYLLRPIDQNGIRQ